MNPFKKLEGMVEQQNGTIAGLRAELAKYKAKYGEIEEAPPIHTELVPDDEIVEASDVEFLARVEHDDPTPSDDE